MEDLRPTIKTFPLPHSFNLDLEWEELKLIMASTPSEVVLCHNDLQEGNILIVEKDPERRLINGLFVEENIGDEIRMIDFEYAAYNHRGFDLSQHFTEYCYDYDVDEFPNFVKDANAYPSKERQMQFYLSYLRMRRRTKEKQQQQQQQLRHATKQRKNSTNSQAELGPGKETEDVEETELEELYRETNVYALFTHLVWALWALRQASLSKIPFGFVEYGIARVEHYLDHKRWLEEEGLIKNIKKATAK